jgi:hypothetical protein
MTDQNPPDMRTNSPKATSSVSILILISTATLLFLATEGTCVFVFVRSRHFSVEYSLLIHFVPLLTPIPWVVGLLTHLRMKKLFARFPTAEGELQSAVVYLAVNGVVASYCALLPIALLLANFVMR